MYPFLQDFKVVSVAELEKSQNLDGGKENQAAKLYCLNDDQQLTHLLVRCESDLSFLTELVSIESLTLLALHNCQLTEIPDVVFQCVSLTVLDLDANLLTRLTESIGQLTQLKHLSLNNNKINGLPNKLGQLKQLTRFELSRNQLTTLPKEIGHLSQLNHLDLHNNQLTALPKEFGQLSQLQTLSLYDNQLTALPKEIGHLSQLQDLYLNGNQLTALPKEIGHLSQLQTLYLHDNRINQLPPSMAQLSALQEFYIFLNPITENTHEMADSLPPLEHIAYLLEIQKPETQTLNEAKVLVLGDERVGKTSLINRIIGREMDEDEKTTLGIDIQQYRLKNGININIWDFAGQEITHQTHQFFLSHRSLYLLALDGQKQDDDAAISQWLNTIKTTAGDAPIVVVINKCDRNPGCQFDIFRYQQDFNIVKVLYTTAADEGKLSASVLSQIEHSIDDLVSVIEQQIGQIKEVKLPFPPAWLAVKQALEDEKDKQTDFIESSIYEQLCEQNGVTNPIMQDALLTILNQIGTIVTYKEHERLNVMQIINPIWVTNGVYKVLRSGLIKAGEATLNRNQFQHIFANDSNDTRYSKSRHYTWLIDLLKQFRLAFSIDEQQILIPSRLETTQPDFVLADFQQGLNFRFVYQGILKTTVISQFIVLMHEYITTDTNKYWKRGVFLNHDTAKAVVISNEEQKTITIAIAVDKTTGANRAGRELLTIIRHAIRKINGPELDVEEQVPLLVEHTLLGFKSYDEILEAEEEGEKNIRGRVSQGDTKSRSFSVTELLDGYRIEDKTDFDYAKLDKDLFEIACLETENRHAIFNEKEDLTNDRFKTALLNRQYRVSDQTRAGESGTGLNAGELDLLIRNNQTGLAECVIEAFVLKNHDTKVINSHLSKLMHNYDTTGNRHNYAISYVKSARFYALWKSYQAQIPDFTDTSGNGDKTMVLTGYSDHGRGRYKHTVHHLFINFFTGELVGE